MRNAIRHAALALALVLLAGSSLPAADNDALRIADVRSGWQEAMNERDLFGMLAWYAPGAVVLPAAAAPRLGAEEIADWHARSLFRADVHYHFERVDLKIDGRQAVEEWVAQVTVTPHGDAVTTIGGDPMQFRRSGVRVYRKGRAGRWRIDREVWNDDLPEVRELELF